MNIRRAQQRARSLLKELNVNTVPIDVVALAKRKGVTVIAQSLDEKVSGLLVLRDDGAVIGVNDGQHMHRQRFTIAHELGHYVLHRNDSNIFIDSTLTFYRDENSSSGVFANEVEANAFAAELLMPEQSIREYLGDESVDVYDEIAVQDLASYFDVSTQAMTIRLINLNMAIA